MDAYWSHGVKPRMPLYAVQVYPKEPVSKDDVGDVAWARGSSMELGRSGSC